MSASSHQKNPAPVPFKPVPAAKHRWLPSGCLSVLFAVFVLAVLAGLMMPCFGCIQLRGSQTKCLAQAKQIGLALKLFASDHDGNYPRQGVPVEMHDAPANANLALACLFPDYTQSETIFGNKLAYGSRMPNNILDQPYTGKPVNTLSAGENAYGYVMGLTDKSAPNAPLLADGTDGTGHYVRNGHARGGVWAGEKAVVIRLDNSGALEPLEGPWSARYIPRRDDKAKNLLDVGYLGNGVRYLDPSVAAP